MPTYVLPGSNPGLLYKGTIDIAARENVRVPVGGGRFASVQSTSWHVPFNGKPKVKLPPNGAEILVPTVVRSGNRWVVVSGRSALDRALNTGKHLGIFDTPAHATSYANRLHLQQAAAGRRRRNG